MKSGAKLVIVIGFVIAALVTVWAARRTASHESHADGTAMPRGSPERVHVTLVYSTEKKAWMEASIAAFQKAHPEIDVTLVGKGSLEAEQAILDGQLQPTLWSPADTMVMNLLASDWQTKNHEDVVAPSGEDAPQALLLTPLVFVSWEDRGNALVEASHGPITWTTIHKAVTARRGWPAVGGSPRWGFVKLGHTDPTKSNSGLEALYLMSLEYTGKPKLAVEDLLDDNYQQLVRSTEKGVPKFESSTGTFMTDMVRFGPSKYDIAVVYESLAISELANASARWGKLKIYYPATTIWSDHPIAVLNGSWVTPEQKTAARALVTFLRSTPSQQRALEYGFRPADTSVPVVTSDVQNPFTRLVSRGVSVEVPPAATAPDGIVVRNLMMMWTRIVQP